MGCARIRTSAGSPRWRSPSTPSTACWSSGARSTSASPDPGRGGGDYAHSPDPCNTLEAGAGGPRAGARLRGAGRDAVVDDAGGDRGVPGPRAGAAGAGDPGERRAGGLTRAALAAAPPWPPAGPDPAATGAAGAAGRGSTPP